MAVGGISLVGEYAAQEMTGRRGYFGKLGSIVENWHMMKTDRDRIRCDPHGDTASTDPHLYFEAPRPQIQDSAGAHFRCIVEERSS